MKIRLILFLQLTALLWGVEAASAQPRASEPLRPRWVQKIPKPTNPTFTYEVKSAFAPTLDAAREKCMAELIAGSEMKNGMVIVSGYQSKELVSQVWKNGKLTLWVDGEFTRAVLNKPPIVQALSQAAAAFFGAAEARVSIVVGPPPAQEAPSAPAAPADGAQKHDALDDLLAFGAQFDNIKIQ